LALAPGNAEVLRESGVYAVRMGHVDTGLAALRRTVVLDPLNPRSHFSLGQGLLFARRYDEAAAAMEQAIAVNPKYSEAFAYRGFAEYSRGDFSRARASCERWAERWPSQWCLSVAYEKLGRHADAEAILAKLKADSGDSAAYQYAGIYAQWGQQALALNWLDTAMRLRDSGLEQLKVDPLLDPLRAQPRFKAIEQELRFPD
jgi:tetratricopeptide (TPR) repeat protein